MRYYDPESTTKTEQTKARYVAQAEKLLKRYRASGESGDDVAFVDWLIALKPTIKSPTWRSYKSSVVWYLTSRNRDDLAERLAGVNSDGCMPRMPTNKRGPGKKKKSVTEDEESKIFQHFQGRIDTNFWAIPASAFFKATLLVGLRPIEWQGSTLYLQPVDGVEGPFPVLKVKNAKDTNGRAHGEYRYLHLHDMDKDDIKRVYVALMLADPRHPKGWLTPSGKAESWDEFYKKLSDNFAKAIRSVFPRSKRGIALYSARHQFIADLKYAEYPPEEIAAIVGHAVDDTAGVHYGRKRNGRSGKGGLPKANPSDVARVRVVSTSVAPSPHKPA